MLSIRILVFCLTINTSWSYLRFKRDLIERAGSTYYRVKLTIGNCRGTRVFEDKHLWVRNSGPRVVDIFWKAYNPDKVRVSQAEVDVILNSTDVSAITESGLGQEEFRATLFLPGSCSRVLYTLRLWSCGNISSKFKAMMMKNKPTTVPRQLDPSLNSLMERFQTA